MSSYVWPNSDKQIQALQKDDNLFFRACLLISKLFWNVPREEIVKLLSVRQDDSDFYRELVKISKQKTKGGKDKPAIVKNAILAKSFLGKIHVKKYLDYGAGNLTFAYSLMKLLGLKTAWAVDVPQEFEKGWDDMRKRFPMIQFAFIQKEFPFKEKFDLVSCIMVMHHIENVQETIKLFSSIVNKNGYLLIKEHDCFDEGDQLLVDVEHSLYLARNESFEKIKEQKMWCKTHTQWTEMISKAGFKFIKRTWVFTNKEEIAPTRHYFALYQKL